MDVLTCTSVPVSAANHRDPSFMTRIPRRAGFQPPLIVVALRLTAVSRDTWATAAGAGATGPTNPAAAEPAAETAAAARATGPAKLTGADSPVPGAAADGVTSIPAGSAPAGPMAAARSSAPDTGGGAGRGSSAALRTGPG